MPVLSLSGVTVVRDGATLLAGVDWVVEEGERWALLGPNGAGKTTLLAVASASLFPNSGTVTLLGERFGEADLGELRTRVGLSSAALSDRVPGHERAVDVVVTAAYGVVGRWTSGYDPADVARATELLARVGLRAFAERKFGSLSEGERKRVLPGASPMVLVTHHVEEIPVGTTHAMLLSRGRVVAAGPITDVITGPLLSQAFGIPLQTASVDGRWLARFNPGP